MLRSARPVRPRLARRGVVLGGIVALQAVLYGPSLVGVEFLSSFRVRADGRLVVRPPSRVGMKILLPLRLFTDPGFYLLPDTPRRNRPGP